MFIKTVFDVANWFLAQGEITHKKLQKLCYYAQAWHCALFRGTPIFRGRIEAWVHGPVIPELYKVYEKYGWDVIPGYDGELSFSDGELSVLTAVYNTYWEFDGDFLEALTRRENPWIFARGDLRPWESCANEIGLGSMREYYAKLYKKSQND